MHFEFLVRTGRAGEAELKAISRLQFNVIYIFIVFSVCVFFFSFNLFDFVLFSLVFSISFSHIDGSVRTNARAEFKNNTIIVCLMH